MSLFQPLPARPRQKPLNWKGCLAGFLVVLLLLVLIILAAFLPTHNQTELKHAPAVQYAVATVTQEPPSTSIYTTTESELSTTTRTSTSTGLTTEEYSPTLTTTTTPRPPDSTKTVRTTSSTMIISSTTASRTASIPREPSVVSVTSTTVSISTALATATSTEDTTLSTRTFTETVESTHKKYKTVWETDTTITTSFPVSRVTESFDKIIRTTKTQAPGKNRRSVLSNDSPAVRTSNSADASSEGMRAESQNPAVLVQDTTSIFEVQQRAISEIWTTIKSTVDITKTIRRTRTTTTWSTTTDAPTATTTDYHPVPRFSFITVDANGRPLPSSTTSKSPSSSPKPPTTTTPTNTPSPEVGPLPPPPRSTPPSTSLPPNCLASKCERRKLLVGPKWCVTTNECTIDCDDIKANACRGICATSDNTMEKAPRCLFLGGYANTDAAAGAACCEMCKCDLCEKQGGGYEWCSSPEKGVKEWPKDAVLEEATLPEDRKWP